MTKNLMSFVSVFSLRLCKAQIGDGSLQNVLASVYNDVCLSLPWVFGWRRRFKERREYVNDEHFPGLPRSSKMDGKIGKVKDTVSSFEH